MTFVSFGVDEATLEEFELRLERVEEDEDLGLVEVTLGWTLAPVAGASR